MPWIATLSAVEQWALGLVVVLFLGLAAHRLALWRDQRSEFATASRVLRDAFSNEVIALTNPLPIELNVRSLLLNAYEGHSKAVYEFRHHLNWFRRRQFDRAWQQYHSGHKFDADWAGIPQSDRLFLEYISFGEDALAIPLALERIRALLQFARPK